MNSHKNLYLFVLVAIVAGVLTGWLWPQVGQSLNILGELFIRLIKMIIAPVIFLTVTLGIASVRDMKQLGRTGLKTIVYFELITTLAMLIGWAVMNVVKPGKGMNIDVHTLDTSSITKYTEKASHNGLADFFSSMIPENFIGAFAQGQILPVLFLAVLTGIAISQMGENGLPAIHFLEKANQLVFKIIDIIMKAAPIGAFGAMAYVVGKFGAGTLFSLGKLMLCVYVTCLLFVLLVLGTIIRYSGTNIFKFLKYIKEEILIVLGTSSSETALPRLMEKMRNAGCSASVTGLVIPTGYSFNLDGTSIYLTMAALFVAQATNTSLTFGEEMTLVGVFLITSKGAAAVTGGGFITLASTLSAVGTIPVEGIVLLLGIDRFMSEARAITNLIGNGVATLVIAKSENQLELDLQN
ncbi:MAG TPA: C4-dicarboxylate transporter DctA [Cytophagaceae bacterium]|nr:C4-dicarboxylate transporter DctA [Cytophagaceae bacterium]